MYFVINKRQTFFCLITLNGKVPNNPNRMEEVLKIKKWSCVKMMCISITIFRGHNPNCRLSVELVGDFSMPTKGERYETFDQYFINFL